jgi:hypothetical protein
MLKIRRVLVVFMAALPLAVVAGATRATADTPAAFYVGSEEGVAANLRYPDGSTAF